MTGGGGRFGASWRFGGDEGRRGRPLALPLRASDVLVECEWERGEEFGRGPLGGVVGQRHGAHAGSRACVSRNYERADAGLEPFARGSSVACSRATGFCLRSSEHPENGRNSRAYRSSETPRALPPRFGGLLTHHDPVWHRERASRALVPHSPGLYSPQPSRPYSLTRRREDKSDAEATFSCVDSLRD